MQLTRIMNQVQRGALIVIEGVDRSGKSTQCKRLVENLNQKNIRTKLINFPDRTTPTGKIIDEYLKKGCELNDQAIHLLFTANRWENVDKIKKLIGEGVTLIVDRYSYSGIVFSSVKKGMDMDWCKQPEIGLPQPDLIFLLTLSQEEMMQRPGFGNERYENANFQAKVAKAFQKVFSENDNLKKIDASGSVDEVQEVLLTEVLSTIRNVGNSPLETLRFN